MDITNTSFKTYLFGFRYQLILLAISLVFLSSLIWYVYPTYSACCDAAGYWKISDDLSIMTNNPIYGTRTFAYPLLIMIARYVPQLLKLGTNFEYSFLSLLQLLLHYLSVVTSGYAVYILTRKKSLASVFIYVFGLNIFLVAFTNQILTDGVAISFLAIVISLFIRITICSQHILLTIIFAILAGLLPIIRPALFLVSITLYLIFVIFYLYKNKINVFSLRYIFLSATAFLIPIAIQTLQNPSVFEILRGLGKFHVALGSYMYKYVTLLNPTPYGYAAFNHPMKQLIDSCELSNQSSNCVNQVLISHPLMTLGHYATKIFALIDQVYLTTYIHNFFTPERHIWRLINCIFLASSLLGCLLVISKAVQNISKYFMLVFATLAILISLILPLITSVPEERFGLTFHPFFALATSYFFCNIFVDGKLTAPNFAKISIKMIAVFFVLASSLFLFSLYIESTFGIRLNG
jgi:hypothetical protein